MVSFIVFYIVSFLLEYYIIYTTVGKRFLITEKLALNSYIKFITLIILSVTIRTLTSAETIPGTFNIIVFLCFGLYFLILSKNSFKLTLYWYMTFYLILFLSEVFLFILNNVFINNSFLSNSMIVTMKTVDGLIGVFILMLVSKLIIYVLMESLAIIALKRKIIIQYYSIEFTIIVLLIIVLLIFTSIIGMNVESLVETPVVFFNIFLIILFSLIILFLFLFLRIIKTSDEHIKRQKLVETLENRIKLNTTIETAEKNLKALRHNISNNFTVISGLVEMEEYSKLKEYVYEINNDIYDAHKIVFLENKALEVLVNNKVALAKKHNINFKTIISPHTIINFKDNDLCDMMGNIWDNAIEAASEEKGIKTVISMMNIQDGYYVIICENPYVSAPNKKGIHFISTKGENRGIGTQNIISIVDEYNGTIEYEFDNGTCYVCIKFPIKELEQNKVEIILKEM